MFSRAFFFHILNLSSAVQINDLASHLHSFLLCSPVYDELLVSLRSWVWSLLRFIFSDAEVASLIFQPRFNFAFTVISMLMHKASLCRQETKFEKELVLIYIPCLIYIFNILGADKLEL